MALLRLFFSFELKRKEAAVPTLEKYSQGNTKLRTVEMCEKK